MRPVVTIETFMAEKSLRDRLAAAPHDAEALSTLANLCLVKESYDEAVELLERLHAQDPRSLTHRNLLSHALARAGRVEPALALARETAEQWPEDYETQLHCGQVAAQAGDNAACATALLRCVTLNPEDLRPHATLANALTALGQSQDAIQVRHDHLVRALPELPYLLCNLANDYRILARQDETMAVMRVAKLLSPHLPFVAEHMARAHLMLCEPEAAQAELDRARELGETTHLVEVSRAAALHQQGRTAEGLDCLEQALEQAPDDATARNNRGLMRMCLGRWQDGLPDYEARLRLKGGQEPDRKWRGEAVDGTLLLYGEQGLGDQIQCLRYIPLLRRLAKRVAVQVAPPLLPLAQCVDGVDEWGTLDQPHLHHDRIIPMMSLIGILDQGPPGTAPVPLPFLRAPATASVPLPQGDGLKVGLCWAGNPVFGGDLHRSMPASEAARLMRRVPQARYWRLHRGPVSRFVGELAPDLAIADTIKDCDMADTLAIIDRLDLVITVDTAIAHLAGGLGKETWLLLPFVPCFRWGRDPEHSPLYPNTVLFRQPRFGEGWAETMDRVAERLTSRITGILTTC